MLDNSITLPVDVANNGTIVNQVISRHEESANRTRYTFPTHSLVSRDVVDFYRTMPKRAGNFNGVAKSAIKVTTDVAVPGVDASTTLTAPQIGEVAFAIPVGASSASIVTLRQRLIAIIDHALTSQLTEKLEI